MKKLDVELHRNGYERDNFVISDDDAHLPEESEDDDDDAFEPIREVGGIRSARKRKLGPPITIDHKLERLNPTHCMVVDEFMVHAKRECEKVCPLACFLDCPRLMFHRSCLIGAFEHSHSLIVCFERWLSIFPKVRHKVLSTGKD